MLGQLNFNRRPVAQLILLLLFLSTAGCSLGDATGPRVLDLTGSVEKSELPLPDDGYGIIAWMSSDLLILDTLEQTDRNQETLKLLAYDPNNGEYAEVQYQSPEHCSRVRFLFGQRLADGRLVVSFECLQLMSRQFSLLTWDGESNYLEEWFEFAEGFVATDFSFHPNMTSWFQERTGDGLFNELYSFTVEGGRQQLFSEYARAGVPALSPDGEELVFALNTETGQQGGNPFSGLGGLQSAMNSPWNLYVQDQSSGDLQLIFTGVQVPESVKWSPTGDLLAMAAIYDGKSGIWLFDRSGAWLARVWPDTRNFEWSPDGSQLLLSMRRRSEPETMDDPAVLIQVRSLEELPEN